MKVVILAGGYGTRLGGETADKPKPMVEIGGKPIIWHIMKIYSSYGFNDFIILLGYKGEAIKNYFVNYHHYQNDINVDLENNKIEITKKRSENWKIDLLESGLSTMTGGRLKYIKDYINNEKFFLTYGDGLADINIKKLLEFHEDHNKMATVSAVQPPGRYGSILFEDSQLVSEFVEKPSGDGNWMNGGFFICEPSVIEKISNDKTIFEEETLTKLTDEKELVAYKHSGFWACMDTAREKDNLNKLWNENKAPWRKW